MHLRRNHGDHVTLGNVALMDLAEMDVILMRKDPPFDLEYIVATYVLERAEEQGALAIMTSGLSANDAN